MLPGIATTLLRKNARRYTIHRSAQQHRAVQTGIQNAIIPIRDGTSVTAHQMRRFQNPGLSTTARKLSPKFVQVDTVTTIQQDAGSRQRRRMQTGVHQVTPQKHQEAGMYATKPAERSMQILSIGTETQTIITKTAPQADISILRRLRQQAGCTPISKEVGLKLLQKTQEVPDITAEDT